MCINETFVSVFLIDFPVCYINYKSCIMDQPSVYTVCILIIQLNLNFLEDISKVFILLFITDDKV